MLKRILTTFSWRRYRQRRPVVAAPSAGAQWSIGIYVGDGPLSFHPSKQVTNPVITAAQVTDRQAGLVADPFMVKDADGCWQMFFEVEVILNDRRIGQIGLASSEDGFAWRYQQIVLKEPFHLSYPYVFHHRGETYLIPETRSMKEIRLYRAIDFPTRWTMEKVLLKGRRFADNSLIRHADTWWMFTDSGNTTLRLYHSPHLTGPWREHQRSPLIRKNPMIARPGGRVIASGGRCYRYAQDDLHGYGNQVWGFEILEMARHRYREQRHTDPIVGASGSGWNALGMHTIDPHPRDDGRWFACVDGFGEVAGP